MTANTLATREGGISAFLDVMGPRLAEVATDHMTPERMLKLFAAATSATPKLRDCTVESLAACLLLASQLGLEPASPLGHLYLVPYGSKCTPIIGYKGMLHLIRNTGEVRRVNARVFYRQELESGDIQIGLEPPSVSHQWTGETYSDDDIAGAYCIIEGVNGEMYLETVTRAEIDARRSRSAAGGSGPWKTDFAAMARKCAVRKLFGGGTVPISAEKMGGISMAMEGDGDSGEQAPRMTRAQVSMSQFAISKPAPAPVDTTADVVDSETGEVSTPYSELAAICERGGHSAEYQAAALLECGYINGNLTSEGVDEVLTAIERAKGA